MVSLCHDQTDISAFMFMDVECSSLAPTVAWHVMKSITLVSRAGYVVMCNRNSQQPNFQFYQNVH